MLDVTDLSVSYGAIHAIRGVSFSVGKGELVSLLGANGAGKSSTIKCIAGALKAAGGAITLEGRDITAASPEQVVHAGLATVPATRKTSKSCMGSSRALPNAPTSRPARFPAASSRCSSSLAR